MHVLIKSTCEIIYYFQIKNDIGFVDILINNAGIVTGKSILDLEEEAVFRTFNVNVISHFWVCVFEDFR